MNLELFESFAFAIHPADAEKRVELFENLKLGRLKEFDAGLMQEVVDHYLAHRGLPSLYCEDVQNVLPSSDKQNYKVLAHVAGCECCSSKVT